ncbi:glycerol-3-phosphate 1-O-acyltransferase PlsY [Thorsellia anophelis]|uniref:Glycerol-3-phosphate acyltransferase n=1 Tax=Thorsellia anophelis DSM 18579 TaxID=1123402 RepID=A0A1H9Y4G5_9GAMM|nr:glycerol-3-phosphate 1-O-acyltransferase PlsY [Thorsellia anophelis]SES63756.1 glycerol-3-phosphate acyltransferase PlsY [Thorsellia anophelis DSM 18579]
MPIYFIFLFPAVAYLMGSVSGAILFSKVFNLPDPRTIGSCNPGAANIFRSGKVYLSILVFMFDLLKGMLPVWLAYRLDLPLLYISLTALAVCIGHIYPIFFQFKGGKGVATALGTIAPIGWDLSGLILLVWLLVVLISGYSSLASVITAVLAPIFIWWFRPEFTFPVSVLACLIIWRHHDNLERLWKGGESKLFRLNKRKK